jgi:hypothetical protein
MARDEGSKVDNMDHRFALVDSDGVERYPYRMKKRDGQFGFVLGRDRDGEGEVVQTIEEVIRGVVFDGKRVRTSDFPPTPAKGSSGLSLAAAREVQGYRIDPSLAHMVAGASVQPMGAPGEGRAGKSPEALTAPSRPSAAPRQDIQKQLDAMPVSAFEAALQEVEPAMTPPQREMLRGHANAQDQELSMQEIAEHGGYADYATANIQYGRLGRLFSQALGIDAEQLTNKVQAICFSAGRSDEAGHFVWRLRPQLAEALYRAGWHEPSPAATDDPAAAGAAAEVAADPQCQGVAETTRQALVNARIGQGGYRQRMMHVWDGRCAVTGLGITEALTASHAKAWKLCDNRERLDEFNGLLLAATVDRLFDTGLISFSDDGAMLVKVGVSEEQLGLVGLSLGSRLRHVPNRAVPYLAEHRQRFGFNP